MTHQGTWRRGRRLELDRIMNIIVEKRADMEYWTCKSKTGEKRISPGPTIFEGKYWLVEHAYPVKVIGWIVIVLKRDAEALHELTAEEFAELAQIQARLIPLLHTELHSEKEYVSC